MFVNVFMRLEASDLSLVYAFTGLYSDFDDSPNIALAMWGVLIPPSPFPPSHSPNIARAM